MEENKINLKEKLNIRLVLDRSGSMSACKTETIDSINEYIASIQKRIIGRNFYTKPI